MRCGISDSTYLRHEQRRWREAAGRSHSGKRWQALRHGPPGLFTLNTDGSGYQIIHTFTSAPPFYFYDAQPLNVIEGQDGVLYGITSASYLQSPDSLLYGVQKDGSGFTALHQFTSSGATLPLLVQGENGVLYGGVVSVSPAPAAVYSVSTKGGGFSVLRYFPGQTVSSLVPRPGGVLLGSA